MLETTKSDFKQRNTKAQFLQNIADPVYKQSYLTEGLVLFTFVDQFHTGYINNISGQFKIFCCSLLFVDTLSRIHFGFKDYQCWGKPALRLEPPLAKSLVTKVVFKVVGSNIATKINLISVTLKKKRLWQPVYCQTIVLHERTTLININNIISYKI